MTLILRGRKFGIKLEELRQWLLIYDNEGSKAQMKAFVDVADRQLSELRDQRDQLDEAIAELSQIREHAVQSSS